MKIGESYNTNVTAIRIDETKIPSLVDAMEKHPRIKRCISEKGILLYAENVTDLIEHFDDEVVMRISVSIGDIEQDCFDVGYYSYSKGTTIEEIADKVCKENFFGFTCERMINNYVPIQLGIPAPFERAKKTQYISNDEEKVDITYISETMCHSIMRKLWDYAKPQDTSGSTLDDLVKDTGLTEDEFNTLMTEYH